MTEEKKPKAPKSVRIDGRLLAGMNREEKAIFLKSFTSSKIVREILAERLTKLLDNAIIESESIKIYESPNALPLLADLQGYRKALRDCIKLIHPEETNE